MRERKKKRSSYKAESALAAQLDNLAEFEHFKNAFLPRIQNDIKNGLSSEEIYKKYAPLAAARAVMITLTEPDSGKALAASRDIQDRTTGKAKERKEIEHKFENLPEEQLDAILSSQLTQLDDLDEETQH